MSLRAEFLCVVDHISVMIGDIAMLHGGDIVVGCTLRYGLLPAQHRIQRCRDKECMHPKLPYTLRYY
jgi:hypothetical protein